MKLKLPAGCYTVRVRSCSGLNPGGITKWLKMCPCENHSIAMFFSQPLCNPITVPVSFTVTDANYPGVTNMNGGITIWQHQITP